MVQFKPIVYMVVIVLGIFLSGCTSGQDVTPIVKAIPEVQQFMKEHPNAKITITYWSKDEVSNASWEISRQCNKSITPIAMYKATVSDGDLKVVSWIDAENRIVICSTIEGSQTPTTTATVTQTTIQPTSTPVAVESTVFLGEGERNGPLLVQKIYPDHIEGLNFREYPVATLNGTPINLSIGQTASNGCTITLTLIGIENATAEFLRKEQYNRPCPICLSGNTSIDTPDGKFNVRDLNEGMAVWTSDSSGSRKVAVILRSSKVEVPKDFQLVYIALGDGRDLLASPGHPLADGRILDDIKAGDVVDNSTVVTAKRVPYEGEYTYDILPSGDTGIYWANGIPVKSTLVGSK